MKMDDYFDEYWLTAVEIIKKTFPSVQQGLLWSAVWCAFTAGFKAGIDSKEKENEENNS